MVDCPGSGEALRFLGPQVPRRDRGLGEGLRRLPRDPRRRRPRPDRPGRAGRWAATTRRARPRSRSGSSSSSPGAPTTTGARCRSGGSSARARTRSRTTGSTCSGCGATTTSRRSSRTPRTCTSTASSSRSPCPFLITHGENDRQIPVEYAHQSYDQAVNSPKRELRIFTPEEGATEHVGLDHLPHVGAFIADWIEDTLRRARLGARMTSTAGRPHHRHGRWPGRRGCAALRRGRRHRRRLRHPGRSTAAEPVDLTDEDAVRRWVDAAADGARRHRRAVRERRRHPLLAARGDHQGGVGLRPAARARRGVLPGQARLAAPQAAGGSVVLVGSTAGLTGSMTNARVAHTVTKGGVVALTKQLRPRVRRTASGSTASAPAWSRPRPPAATCSPTTTRCAGSPGHPARPGRPGRGGGPVRALPRE